MRWARRLAAILGTCVLTAGSPSPVAAQAPDPAAVIAAELASARAQARDAAGRLAASAAALRAAEADHAAAEHVLAAAERRHGEAVRRLREARDRVRQQAVGAYAGANIGISGVDALLGAADAQDLVRRSGMLEGVVERTDRIVQDYRRARRAAGDEASAAVTAAARTAGRLQAARAEHDAAARATATADALVDGLSAGATVTAVARLMAFPVAGEHRFSNDFGAPRMPGTELAHAHQGTDVFAPMGTPLVAIEHGVITRVGEDRLGGTKLWIAGESGAAYYYAHLSGYAPGIADGVAVAAGQLVGYVGNTGNARTTPPHLHIEIHPGGGAAVNPFPLLRALSGG